MDPFMSWLSGTFGSLQPDLVAPGSFPAPSVQAPPVPQGPGAVMGPTIEQMNGVNPWDPAPVSAAPSNPPAAPGATPQGANPLATALRGVAPPQVPTPQRVSTPSAPRLADIQSGELLKLLLAQRGGAGAAGGRQLTPLPSTLGQALNVPRY